MQRRHLHVAIARLFRDGCLRHPFYHLLYLGTFCHSLFGFAPLSLLEVLFRVDVPPPTITELPHAWDKHGVLIDASS